MTIQQLYEAPADEDIQSLEEHARPYRALYDHWERTQWTAGAIDFRTDTATFRALSPEKQQGLLWIFSHRFHAEFSVATVLSPFISAAPTYETQLLLAAQISDEFKHMQCVLRIYEEVFGVKGGIPAIRAIAEAISDPVADFFYERFESVVGELKHDQGEDTFLRAVMAYHLIAEGVVARCAQALAGDQYATLGDFPGLAVGQKLVSRDEARHIGFGVTYTRQRLIDDPIRGREIVAAGIEEFASVAAQGFELVGADIETTVMRGYGVNATTFYNELLRLMDVRLRSIGFTD
jgi:ribonucleoside-diphosphate reductase beta chain